MRVFRHKWREVRASTFWNCEKETNKMLERINWGRGLLLQKCEKVEQERDFFPAIAVERIKSIQKNSVCVRGKGQYSLMASAAVNGDTLNLNASIALFASTLLCLAIMFLTWPRRMNLLMPTPVLGMS